MRTHEDETRIALQPETTVEQGLLLELFHRLQAIADAPSHPEKVGNTLVFYTLDVPEYDGLDHELWEEAECGVDEHGRLDPEPGSRALVVIHSGEPDVQVTQVPVNGQHPTEQQVDDAVEAVKDADDDLAQAIADLEPLEEADYGDVVDLSKQVNSTGLMEFPANKKQEELAEHLREYQRLIGFEVA